jgi:hypothetical protein
MAGGGRTLVGNPLLLPLILRVFITTPNLSQEYYMWDPTLGGSWASGAYILVEREQNTAFMNLRHRSREKIHFVIYTQDRRYSFKTKVGATGNASVVFTENSKASLLAVVNPIITSTGDQQLITN